MSDSANIQSIEFDIIDTDICEKCIVIIVTIYDNCAGLIVSLCACEQTKQYRCSVQVVSLNES